MSEPVLGQDGRYRPAWAYSDPLLLHYFDTEWGRPVTDERGVFERISLEAFQSGLSWLTILRKRSPFRDAFASFDPDVVAAFDDRDVARLLADPGIVRNRRKIEATINNAAATIALRDQGGLADLVWSFQPAPDTGIDPAATTSPESIALARQLKAAGFRHVGPTTMHALLQAIGVLDARPVLD